LKKLTKIVRPKAEDSESTKPQKAHKINDLKIKGTREIPETNEEQPDLSPAIK